MSLAARAETLPLSSSRASGPQSANLCNGRIRFKEEGQEVPACLLTHLEVGADIAHGL